MQNHIKIKGIDYQALPSFTQNRLILFPLAILIDIRLEFRCKKDERYEGYKAWLRLEIRPNRWRFPARTLASALCISPPLVSLLRNSSQMAYRRDLGFFFLRSKYAASSLMPQMADKTKIGIKAIAQRNVMVSLR